MKKGISPVILLVAFAVVLMGISLMIPKPADQGNLKKFSSYDELQSFVKANIQSYSYGGLGISETVTTADTTKSVAEQSTSNAPSAPSASTGRGSLDYSQTNIQVQGVDEPDIVKNDGKYVYVVTGRNITIVDAYPAENANIISQIELNGTPQEIFVNGDRLVVFGSEDYSYSTSIASDIGILPSRQYSPNTFINVYDITDRTNPILKRNISVDGNFYDARMIGDYVYAIVNDPVNYIESSPIPMPVIESGSVMKTVAASDIYYFDSPDSSYVFTNILAINTQNDGQDVTSKTFLMGYSENLFVSESNIYITYTKRLSEADFYDRIIDEAVMPAVPADVQSKINEIKSSSTDKYDEMQKVGEVIQNYLGTLGPEQAAVVMKTIEQNVANVQQEIAKEMEKTVIHKISISNGNIEYLTNGEVPGYVLNQFSMDEYNGNLRIATTTGNWGAEQLNHVYVLDGGLNVIGKLEDLAHGERIYSVRFMGDKAYMVTFRQVDPLFVIDLSNPSSPQVLGYLKVNGVSDYLHPYDDTHVIGIGMDATDQGRTTGMKLSLFDVSDFSNPKVISSYIIGDMGTYSDALYDHKAFLFDKQKQLLVIPVSITTYPKGPEVSAQQPNYWQGAYVFNVDLTNGFVLKGNVTHANETANNTYYDYASQITRSLFIDGTLYTLSSEMIKANNLTDLSEISTVNLPQGQNYIYPYYISSGTGGTVSVGVATPQVK